MPERPFALLRLGPSDVALLRGVNRLFGEVFDEPEEYAAAPPTDSYLQRRLAREDLLVLAALADGAVVGALVAYELAKLERECREYYIYDLGVAAAYRRRGIASALIEAAREIAAERGAHVLYIQAEAGDDRAIALYTRFAEARDIVHFEIAPAPRRH